MLVQHCVGFVAILEIKYSTKFSNSSGFISISIGFFFFFSYSRSTWETELGIDVSDYDLEID